MTAVPEAAQTRALPDGLARLNLPAGPEQIERLHGWLDLLARWGRAFNLTAIPAAQRIPQLVLMSAAVVPHLKAGHVLDVGSGAGVPGIPLAILAPGNDYTLLDSNGKKTRFLEQCRLELGLGNVRVARVRVEVFESAPFDTIVARAFTGLEAFLAATRHLAHASTRRLAFTGAAVSDKVQHPPPDRAKWRLHRLEIPGGQPATLAIMQAGG